MKKIMKWIKDNFGAIVTISLYVIIWLIVLSSIATSITACVMYGDKPITEIPAWALLFMFGKVGK